jgi:Haem-NO-binding
MVGIINNAIADLVVQRFGESVWEAVAERARLECPVYDSTRNYDDAETMRIVEALSVELAIAAEDVLFVFGKWWIGYSEKTYGALLRMSGDSFLDCLMSLDALHGRIKMAFPDSHPPSFRVARTEDGRILLHYQSVRAGLGSIVRGILVGIADNMGITLQITEHDDPIDGHRVFEIQPSGLGSWDAINPVG